MAAHDCQHCAPLPCPHCGAVNDHHGRATSLLLESAVPTVGDMSVCAQCGQPSMVAAYNGHRYLRIPTDKELPDIHSHPGWAAAQFILQHRQERRGR